MPRPVVRVTRLRFGLPLLLLAASLPNIATAADRFYPADHALAGLPTAEDSAGVYAPAPEHPLNRLHQLLFVRPLIAEEIQSQLPAERARSGQSDTEFFTRGWYFGKREGTAADQHIFGGDVRVSPVRSFSEAERQELLSLLGGLATRDQIADIPELAAPLARLLLQWDLLSTWWNLERANSTDVELLTALARSIAALAQARDVLVNLPDGLSDLHQTFPSGSAADRAAPYLPADFPPTPNDAESKWVEVGRKSSALFKADRSLRASRVFLNLGDRSVSTTAIAAAAAGQPPEVPSGAQTGLVQMLIGIDEELQPVSTPVIDEVRIRTLTAPFELSAAHPSSSRDGSSHWIYLRTRSGSLSPDLPDFRFVPDTFQAMFLEYGSLKHATFAAQCALCHRLTNNGGQAPGGIRMLAKHLQPHVASADERPTLAEAETAAVAAQLRKRLAAVPVARRTEGAPTTSKLKPRAERSADERLKLAGELRQLYSAPPEQWPAPHIDPGVAWRELGLLPKVEHPADNPHSAAKELLGKTLFFDPRISGSGQLACASCHDPDLHWADGRTTSFGHTRKLLGRNSPTIRNVAFATSFFWDGRAATLEDQARQVLQNPDEMHATPEHVVSVLAPEKGYQILFCDAFDDETITFDRVAEALACYQRTLVGGASRFDAFLKGKSEALTDREVLGLDLFRRDGRCLHCHNGPLFSDGQFHEVGLSYYGRSKYEDLGRHRVTASPQDVGRFRTPSLRDVTATTPLMHNGLFELRGVLNMYNAGMPTLRRKPEQTNDASFPTKSPHLKPLGLNSQDLEDLASFLAALEEPKQRVRPPELPGLHPEP